MALALLLLSKTKTKYCAKRNRKENEHREDVALRTYAGTLLSSNEIKYFKEGQT